MSTQNQALRAALVQQQKRVKELEDAQLCAEDDKKRLQVKNSPRQSGFVAVYKCPRRW